jgi:hypothetical protein
MKNFYFLLNSKIDPIKVKTLHDTNTTSSVSNHISLNIKPVAIKYDIAHINHFRLYYSQFELSISDIVFDYNYFFCYFKPIAFKFNEKNQL